MSDRDWKSDPVTGELVFADGDIVMVSDSPSSPDSIRQDVEERLRLFAGEWFLSDPASTDPADGIPYLTRLLGKGGRQAVVASIFRKAILATPGVTAITSLTVQIDRPSRTGTVTWVAATDYGTIGSTTTI